MAKGVYMKRNRPLRVAMVAYAQYFTDARIKNYVDALLDSGAQVDVIALGKQTGSISNGALTIYNVGTKYQGSSTLRYVAEQLFFLLKAFLHLTALSLRGKYNVVHAHNMPDFLAFSALPFKLLGTKVILDIHDTMPEAYATKFELPLESIPIKLLVAEEVLSAACADRVIATNVMHEEVLVGHGVPKKKMLQILNVGNEKIFKPKPHSGNGKELWLGYHGTIAKRLGVFLIVDALHLVKEDCPGVRFLCVGEGDDVEAMKVRAGERGVSRVIEWKPFVEVEKLPDVLQRVSVGVIGNTRETEVKRNYMLPVKMLEYAAMEIPTIVPKLKILQRYFDESSAFFYEPDDAADLARVIRLVYEQRSEIAARVEGLRAFNAIYNWRKMAERYLNTIDELSR